jgi:rhodanese-related sulfurtransferase
MEPSMDMTSFELAPHAVEPADFTVIDVRTPGEFASGYVPGAVNVPLDELGAAMPVLRERAMEGRLLVVCASGNRSGRARAALAEAGIPAVSLVGGTTAWQSGGRELSRPTSGRKVWAMERQVRFTAGLVVVAAVALDMAVPGARWVAAAIGAGLVYSAVSDTCGLAVVLSRLPHNRPRATGAGWRTELAARGEE